MKLNLYASKNCQGPSIQAFACSEGLSSFLVLRVSFTLFNLQGARRCYSGFSLYHIQFALSRSFFFHSKQTRCRTVSLSQATLLGYHIQNSLSRTFFGSFSKFFLFSPRRPLRRPDQDTTLRTLCQELFSTSRSFHSQLFVSSSFDFPCSLKGLTPRSSACLY